MNSTVENNKLISNFGRVGLRASDPLDIGFDTFAETWISDYAEVYVVDAATLAVGEMPELLSRLDSTVAKRLREQRDIGRYLDAHVCIMVNKDLLQSKNLARESDASHYVSRKYWIDHESPVDDILRRLTLTWIDVGQASEGVVANRLEEFEELRARIEKRKGAGAAKDFLAAATS